MLSNSFTLAVLKCERSKPVKPLQPLNMPVMSVMWEVSRLDKSILVKLLHALKKFFSDVILEVFKWVISKLFKEVQFSNKPSILVTWEVSNLVKSEPTSFKSVSFSL